MQPFQNCSQFYVTRTYFFLNGVHIIIQEAETEILLPFRVEAAAAAPPQRRAPSDAVAVRRGADHLEEEHGGRHRERGGAAAAEGEGVGAALVRRRR